MTTIVSFNETTSRQIAALADAEGSTGEQWLNRYVFDIDRACRDRGGVEAIEAETAARRAAAEEAARLAAENSTTTETTTEEA